MKSADMRYRHLAIEVGSPMGDLVGHVDEAAAAMASSRATFTGINSCNLLDCPPNSATKALWHRSSPVPITYDLESFIPKIAIASTHETC